MNMIPFTLPSNSCKATIEYPCSWQYKVIGTDRAALAAAIAECVEGREHLVTDSHVSRHGRYKSLNLEIVVDSEDLRIAIQKRLASHGAVKVVL